MNEQTIALPKAAELSAVERRTQRLIGPLQVGYRPVARIDWFYETASNQVLSRLEAAQDD